MTQQVLDFTAPIPLAAARAAGEEAGNRAADRAERATAEFREKAATCFLKYLAAQPGGLSTGELMTDAAKQAGIRPPDDRAFGPVFQALSRGNKIAFDGFVPRTKGHGSAGGKRWRLVLG